VIISVHIPKTAGRSFHHVLAARFGDRLLDDNGDFPESMTAESVAHRRETRARVIAEAGSIAQRYDAIHGHFTADKYAGIFPDGRFTTMMRDPYQQAISTFAHARRLKTPTLSDHPELRKFRDEQMSLIDLIAAYPNHQTMYFGGLDLEEFAMVGISERYDDSLALFERIFDQSLPRATERKNVNPAKTEPAYDVPDEVRRAVDAHRARDLEWYRRACERFARQLREYRLDTPTP